MEVVKLKEMENTNLLQLVDDISSWMGRWKGLYVLPYDHRVIRYYLSCVEHKLQAITFSVPFGCESDKIIA